MCVSLLVPSRTVKAKGTFLRAAVLAFLSAHTMNGGFVHYLTCSERFVCFCSTTLKIHSEALNNWIDLCN